MDFSDHDEGDEEEEESQSMEEIPPNLPNTIPSVPSPKPFSTTSLPQPQKATNSTPSFTRYRECLKNHAVNIGGHAVDGCGEFMASGDEGTLDALRCAACNCHRNFHRKEPSNLALPSPNPNNPTDQPLYNYNQHQHPQFSPYYRTPAGYLHHHHLAAAAARPMMPLALPSTSGGHSRDEGDDMSHPMGMMGLGGTGGMMGLGGSSGSGSGKKRFRTKFSQEQKDKMLAFAERVGWRIQKHDEQAVQQFCNEINVKRHVLKVWMHNNKHTLGKKP